jgi:hypothetical protein
VIDLPAYSPTVVYGTWPYPSYLLLYYRGVMSWYPGQTVVNGLKCAATERLAKQIPTFNPDATWQKVSKDDLS